MTEEQGKIRVMVVDDHDMVRRGLAAYFNTYPDLILVGEASDGKEALEVCKSQRPDVVLMDLIMPGLGGIEATRRIREQYPDTQVIALSSYQDKDLVKKAIQVGAISFLLKNVSGDDLADAVRSANAGQGTLAPEVTHDLIMASQQPQLGHDLTPREREVLALMVEGLTNPQIANRLSISRATATAHVSHILSKLRVSNRQEAIVLAIRGKLVN